LLVITQDWCARRLTLLGIAPEEFSLEDILVDCTPKHLFMYLQLRQSLDEDVFHLGFQLPRCHPPNGAYNWTPPITDFSATVATLSLIGEEAIEDVNS